MTYNALKKGRHSEPGREYVITTVVQGRLPVFQDLPAARACIRQLFRSEQETDERWLAWVLMPDHLHGLLVFGSSWSLTDVVRRFKGASARAVNQTLGRRGALWQPGFYDRAPRQDEDRISAARYIVANPLRAKLAARLGDYPHWDSVWL